MALLALPAFPLRAELLPEKGSGDARLRHVSYSPDEVVRLIGAVGFQIHLQFGEGEEFVNLAAGDTAAVDVGAVGPHVMLKPRMASGATNLMILTNRHVYHFDYRIIELPESYAMRDPRVMWSVRFEYPKAAAVPAAVSAVAAGSKASSIAEAGGSPAARRSNYLYRGETQLKPRHVEDDGTHTRFTFARSSELPAIFAIGSDGAETLVNSHVEGDTVIVHAIAQEFVLRRGRSVGCVRVGDP